MSHWHFVLAAYALALVGVAGLWAASALRMRRAEKRAEALRRAR
jgi:heme exporter protein D